MAVHCQDYYKALGVERSASHEEIQRAYRKLARQYHPDINKAPDAEEKFKKINEAYEVLGDQEKRAKYDSLGADWQGMPRETGFTPPPQWEFHYGGEAEPGDFSDFFNMFFGGRQGFAAGEMPGGGIRQRPGRDAKAEIEVTLSEIFHGGRKTIELERLVRQPDGTAIPVHQSLEVSIPKGVTDGTRVRLQGQGGEGMGGGPRGDLYLRVRVRPDPRFEIEDHNLLYTLPVAPWEAALGSTVTVPTVEGEVKMTLPAGTSSGQVLRLSGKGIPRQVGPPGDQLVTVRVVVPKSLSDREKELFKELARESRFRPRT